MGKTEYWHDIVTEKSWNILKGLTGKFDFILIGGWAAYLWSRGLKSMDIDIIVDFSNLDKLKKEYDLRKNDSLKKYEIKIEEIDIDIYIPYYSKLTIPAEDILKEKAENIEGFSVISKEMLLLLKQGAEQERGMSEKGEKDRFDIFGLLLYCDINYKKYYQLLNKYGKESYFGRLISLIKNFREYKYFEMTPRQFRLKKEEILKKLKSESGSIKV